MTKAKLFSYHDSQIYLKKYGINPEKHFDNLRENYGTDFAVEIVDKNMQKAFECIWKECRRKEKERQRILEAECPFC